MTILFSHIPKIAGTSIKSLIASNSSSTIFVEGQKLSLLHPQLDFLNSFRNSVQPALVMGHFSYGVHRLLGVKPKYVTVLRNPIDRIISLYRFLKSTQFVDNYYYERLNEGMSLFQFTDSCVTEQTNNHMCRIIAGIPPDSGMLINEDWLLELALHNLRRHYMLVGTVERVEEFTVTLGGVLGWRLEKTPRFNINKGAPVELDELTKKSILDRNHLDMKLYEWVQKKSSIMNLSYEAN